jgi:outer membrane protein assembly factor BamB
MVKLVSGVLIVAAGAALFVLVAAATRTPLVLAQAQKVAVAVRVLPQKGNGASSPTERGFGIAFDDRLNDSMTTFEELVHTRAWEKAFRVLADIPDDKWSSMLPNASGFVRPASQRVHEAILELPPEGREAFRLFFDAKARLLFDSIRTAEKEEDAKIAHTIDDRYFITSVGDDAADRVADDEFEKGEFAQAARHWKSIFDFHPDTNLSEPKLLLKRGIALFRAGLNDEFQNVRGQVERDFPAARVVIGGQEVGALDYLNRLIVVAKTNPPVARPKEATVESSLTGLAPEDETKPVWQFRFLEDKDWTAIQAAVRNYYGMPSMLSVVPPAATDGRRVYCNWLGATFAIDLPTGKMVWKSLDPKNIVSQLRVNNGRMSFYNANTGQFALAAANGLVASVSMPFGNPNHFRLAVYEAATGKELWSSDRGDPNLRRLSFIGTPSIDGDQLLTVSYQPEGSNELFLRALEARTGTELWSVSLGMPQLIGDPDWGRQFVPIPALARSGRRLYVMTNDGALLAVNLASRRVEWVFKYEAPPTAGQGGQRIWRNSGAINRHMPALHPIVVRDGTIYFKESSSPTLYAVDEEGPRLKWKWQDAESANLVGIDDTDVYLFSNELCPINRAKPEMRWSRRFTVDMEGIGAVVGTKAALVFTSRGLFEVSKETGDDRRTFRGADLGAAGGTMLTGGGRLICISNMSVTAYPEPPAH